MNVDEPLSLVGREGVDAVHRRLLIHPELVGDLREVVGPSEGVHEPVDGDEMACGVLACLRFLGVGGAVDGPEPDVRELVGERAAALPLGWFLLTMTTLPTDGRDG